MVDGRPFRGIFRGPVVSWAYLTVLRYNAVLVYHRLVWIYFQYAWEQQVASIGGCDKVPSTEHHVWIVFLFDSLQLRVMFAEEHLNLLSGRNPVFMNRSVVDATCRKYE